MSNNNLCESHQLVVYLIKRDTQQLWISSERSSHWKSIVKSSSQQHYRHTVFKKSVEYESPGQSSKDDCI